MLQIWFITIATDRIHRQCTRLRCFITTMLGVVFDRHCAKWFIAIPVLDRWFVAVVADRDGSLPLCQTDGSHCVRQRWFIAIVPDRDGSHCVRQRWFIAIVPDKDGSQCARQWWFIHIVPDRDGSSPLWQTEVVGRHRWQTEVADRGGSSPLCQTAVVYPRCARQRWFIASHAGPLSPYVTPRRSQRHR